MRIERRGLLARCLVIAAVILAMVAVVTRMAHRVAPSRHYAQAIARGVVAAPPVTADDAEDQNLVDDELAAGELWAQHNYPARLTDCPLYSAAFRKGCETYLARP